jgi:hypothetical protein
VNSINVPVMWHHAEPNAQEAWVGNYRLRVIGGTKLITWYVDLIWSDAGRSLQPIGSGSVPTKKGGTGHSKQAAEFALIRHMVGGHVGRDR